MKHFLCGVVLLAAVIAVRIITNIRRRREWKRVMGWNDAQLDRALDSMRNRNRP